MRRTILLSLDISLRVELIFVSQAQENRQNPALESFETGQKQEIGQNPALEIQNSVGGRIYSITKDKNTINFFNNRSTNASAECFNAKIKNFRAQLRGIVDVKYFLFRLKNIYA